MSNTTAALADTLRAADITDSESLIVLAADVALGAFDPAAGLAVNVRGIRNALVEATHPLCAVTTIATAAVIARALAA